MEEGKVHSQKEPEYVVSDYKVRANIEQIKDEQNLVLGIIGGGIGGLIGAIAWAALTYFTEFQIGFMAIGVGFLVGFGVRILGKGVDKIFGIFGGIIALASVLLGNFLASLGFLARAVEISYTDVLIGFNYSMTLDLLAETFSVMDLLFYAIAIYAGYRYSFRRITQDQLFDGALTRVNQNTGDGETYTGDSGSSIDE